jgi:hypothetical protein
LKVWCKKNQLHQDLQIDLHFACLSKFPLPTSIPGGPPNPPLNVGPTIFLTFPLLLCMPSLPFEHTHPAHPMSSTHRRCPRCGHRSRGATGRRRLYQHLGLAPPPRSRRRALPWRSSSRTAATANRRHSCLCAWARGGRCWCPTTPRPKSSSRRATSAPPRGSTVTLRFSRLLFLLFSCTALLRLTEASRRGAPCAGHSRRGAPQPRRVPGPS